MDSAPNTVTSLVHFAGTAAPPNAWHQPRPKAGGCMPKLDGTALSNPSNLLEELTLDLRQSIPIPVLEVPKRSPEAKAPRPPKWLNHDR